MFHNLTDGSITLLLAQALQEVSGRNLHHPRSRE